MLQQLKAYIEKEKLFNINQDHILVAVSGGADSMCLLYMLHKLDCKLSVAHCNFKLRGKESDEDEQLVKQVCLERGLTFHASSFDTATYATDHSISIQMAARELRYTWFQELVQEYKYSAIATAHHLNDNVETLLLNLTKGTGINGLVGIAPKNRDIVRPMLFASKQQLLDYINEHSIRFREDASNNSEKYERNYIRHTIIPALKTINPEVEQALGRSISNFRFAQQEVNKKIASYRSKLLNPMQGGFYIYIKQLNGYPFALDILYQLLYPFGFNTAQVTELFTKQDVQSGKEFLSNSHRVIKDRDRLLIVEKGNAEKLFSFIDKETTSIKVGTQTIHFEEHAEVTDLKTEDKSIAYIDARKLEFPLVIRNWEPGDYFYPLGLGKKKKVARFLIDQKVSKPEKENVLVLVSGKKICWVVGHRIDDRFKISSKSRILKIVVN